jgi:hypothetical protein
VDGEFWSEQRKFATRHLRNLGLSGNALEKLILKEVDALVDELRLKCAETNVRSFFNSIAWNCLYILEYIYEI